MSKGNLCEEKILGDVFEQVAPQLRNYLYYKCGNLERSQDLVQEAFSILWQKCKDIIPAAAKSFLYKVATNLLINLAKKDQVRLAFQQQNEGSLEFENPEYQLEYKEYKSRLEHAISSLPEGQREAFLMNRIDKMTYKEIAETLGVSVKAVEKRMHKALLKLKDILNEK